MIDLREKEMINLSRFEDGVCVIYFKRFGGNIEIYLKINFVKVYVKFEWCD